MARRNRRSSTPGRASDQHSSASHRRALAHSSRGYGQTAISEDRPSPAVVYPAGVKPYNLEDSGLWTRFRIWFAHIARFSPARLVLIVFIMLIAFITCLLALPISTAADERAPFVDILFTAISAVCVTGLTVVDTATYWSVFGQTVIAMGIFIGGLGVVTLATILSYAVSRQLGLTQRMLATVETKSSGMGRLTALLKAVIGTSLTAQILLTIAFVPRFLTLGHETVWESLFHAAFMAISVFNNAGFVILSGGLVPYHTDWWMLSPIILGTFVGAIGFPVISDLSQHWRTPSRWALHTKLTLSTYILLVFFGTIAFAFTEWTNSATLGDLDISSRLLNSLLAGVNTRSSGLSSLDVANMRPQTHFIQDIMMMIGGGSVSTAGGIKVTTFAVLLLAAAAEARGDRDIEIFSRRIPHSVLRLAVAVTLLGSLLVALSTVVLLTLTGYSLDVVLFESISAFATVGLSTGITPDLPALAKYVLAALMFAGRTGTMTLAAALALRHRPRAIRQPAESPLIG